MKIIDLIKTSEISVNIFKKRDFHIEINIKNQIKIISCVRNLPRPGFFRTITTFEVTEIIEKEKVKDILIRNKNLIDYLFIFNKDVFNNSMKILNNSKEDAPDFDQGDSYFNCHPSFFNELILLNDVIFEKENKTFESVENIDDLYLVLNKMSVEIKNLDINMIIKLLKKINKNQLTNKNHIIDELEILEIKNIS